MIQKFIHVRQTLPAEVVLQVIESRLEFGKIPAIKVLREITNCGLKEAKDWVDEFDRQCIKNYGAMTQPFEYNRFHHSFD